MANRRVPAALHHELTEYASLLRALRVRDTMDTTQHLTKPSPFALGGDHDDNEELNSDDDLDDDEEGSHRNISNPPTSSPGILLEGTSATPISAKAKGKRKAEDSPPAGKRKQIRRSHWTRWPVPLEDVLLPEWTLEDEVAVIASQVIKLRSPPRFTVSPAGNDEMDDEEEFVRVMDQEMEEDDPDIPFYVPYMTSTVAEYLSRILGVLAALTPARPASMQNRIEPLGWRTIIDIVVTSGIPEFTNARVVQNVIKRMEEIYGPSIIPLDGEKATSYRAVERINEKNEAAARLEQRFGQEFEKYFSRQPSPLPSDAPTIPLPTLKKTRNRKAKKEESGYKPRKKRIPKQKEGKSESRSPSVSAASQDTLAGPSTSVRRSARARSTVTSRAVSPNPSMQE